MVREKASEQYFAVLLTTEHAADAKSLKPPAERSC